MSWSEDIVNNGANLPEECRKNEMRKFPAVKLFFVIYETVILSLNIAKYVTWYFIDIMYVYIISISV